MTIPSTSTQWQNLARLYGLSGSTIFDFKEYHSASKIEVKQFLHLRALCISRPALRLVQYRQTWLAQGYYSKARSLLKSSGPWQSYLDSFTKTKEELFDEPFPELGGIFPLVRFNQLNTENCKKEDFVPKVTPAAYRTRSKYMDRKRNLLRTPGTPTHIRKAHSEIPDPFQTPVRGVEEMLLSNGPSLYSQKSARSDIPEYISPITKETTVQFPASEDEQIVNMALVDFLNAVTRHFVTCADWTPHRKWFRVASEANGKAYEARVDGCLRRRSDDEVLAILETKANVRQNWNPDILMQEAAQMVAWISQYPESCATFREIPTEILRECCYVHSNGY